MDDAGGGSSWPYAKKPQPHQLGRSLTYHHPYQGQGRRLQPARRQLPADARIPHPAVVFYTTSLRGVRRTFTDCSAVRAVLRGFRVAVDERDVSMDAALRRELQALLAARGRGFSLPQLFVGGRLVGGADEVRQLHEAGELRRLLQGAAGQDPAFVCGACGGVRFVPCPACAGSRKVFVEEEGRTSRCADCNENGLLSWGNPAASAPWTAWNPTQLQRSKVHCLPIITTATAISIRAEIRAAQFNASGGVGLVAAAADAWRAVITFHQHTLNQSQGIGIKAARSNSISRAIKFKNPA